MKVIMDMLADNPRFRFKKEEWRLINQICELLEGLNVYGVIDIKKKINIVLDAALIEAAKKEF
jgi:hypothetical protein